jgi:DNA-binding response OmpR family regulator
MTNKKILIVDYDNGSLELLSSIFEPFRFQIVRASDGQSAYEKFKEEKPDIVILEAILPKIHGFDLTKRISEETHGRVPVIIVTGLYRGPQYRMEALSTFGAADYLEKPVDRGGPSRFRPGHRRALPPNQHSGPGTGAEKGIKPGRSGLKSRRPMS